MVLDKAGLLALATLDREEVALPDGSTVFVRCMTVGERDRMEAGYRDSGKADFRARLLVATICGEDGTPYFGESQLHEVRGLPHWVAEPIVEAAIRVNRMGEEEKKEAGKSSKDQATNA